MKATVCCYNLLTIAFVEEPQYRDGYLVILNDVSQTLLTGYEMIGATTLLIRLPVMEWPPCGVFTMMYDGLVYLL
jgi:hypothetical protein